MPRVAHLATGKMGDLKKYNQLFVLPAIQTSYACFRKVMPARFALWSGR